MRKWMIAASLIALAVQAPAQAQDRALHEAVAADYRANLAGLFDHFHQQSGAVRPRGEHLGADGAGAARARL